MAVSYIKNLLYQNNSNSPDTSKNSLSLPHRLAIGTTGGIIGDWLTAPLIRKYTSEQIGQTNHSAEKINLTKFKLINSYSSLVSSTFFISSFYTTLKRLEGEDFYKILFSVISVTTLMSIPETLFTIPSEQMRVNMTAGKAAKMPTGKAFSNMFMATLLKNCTLGTSTTAISFATQYGLKQTVLKDDSSPLLKFFGVCFSMTNAVAISHVLFGSTSKLQNQVINNPDKSTFHYAKLLMKDIHSVPDYFNKGLEGCFSRGLQKSIRSSIGLTIAMTLGWAVENNMVSTTLDYWQDKLSYASTVNDCFDPHYKPYNYSI